LAPVKMRQAILTLFLLTFSLTGKTQSIQLNPEIELDTLAIWMDYSKEIDPALQNRFQKSVLQAIDKFNLEEIGFMVILDSTKYDHSMRMEMGPINYVDGKDNVIWTGVGIITLAGHVYAIATWGFTLPILFLPSTMSKIQIEVSKNLVVNKSKMNRIFVNPFGMYMKVDKQNDKMVKKLEKKLYKFFKQLGKQEEKNNRR